MVFKRSVLSFTVFFLLITTITLPLVHCQKREMVGNMYKTGLPIAKDKITIKLATIKDPRQQDFNEMELFKKMEEKTNIHVEWEYMDVVTAVQKINLILASGYYPDAFFMGLRLEDVSLYAPQGVFVKLNGLISQYGPNIQAAFKQKPMYKKGCTFTDGNIYSLGSAAEDISYYNPDQMFIYKPWLDKLGLQVPKTTDEFYTVLKAFKEKDPNGNGKPDEIPMSFRVNHFIRGMHSLFGAFGRVDYTSKDDPTSHLIVKNGKVIFTADKPEYKEAIQYFHKLFKGKLIDVEGFTQDDKQYFAKGRSQEVILGSFFLWNAVNMVGPEREKDYVPVPPFKGPSGKTSWTNFKRNNGMVNGAGFAIMKSCKNPEIVLRWVDQFYEKQTSIEAAWGPVTKGANGMLEFVSPPKGVGIDEFRYKNSAVWPPVAVFADDYNKVVAIPPLMKSKYEVMKNNYQQYMTDDTFPLIPFTKEEGEWNASTGNDIITYVNDMQAKWLLSGGIENDWDGYLKKLKQLKLSEHVRRMQAVLNKNTRN